MRPNDLCSGSFPALRRQVAMEGKELSMRRVHAIDEELSAGATGGRALEGDPSFVLAEVRPTHHI